MTSVVCTLCTIFYWYFSTYIIISGHMCVLLLTGPDARACCISMKKNVDAELLNDMSKVQMDESGLVGPVQKRPKKYVKPVAPILKGHLAGTSIRSVKNTNKGVKSNSNAPITADATITKDDPFLVSAQIAMPVFKVTAVAVYVLLMDVW